MRSRTIVVRDRIERQKDINEKLQADYDKTKRDRDNLESELNRILSDAERKKTKHYERYGPLSKSVDHTAVQLRSFQQSTLDDQSQFIIKGVSSTENTKQEQKRQMEGVVSTQQCFDEAMSRIKCEVKSIALAQHPVRMPCPTID